MAVRQGLANVGSAPCMPGMCVSVGEASVREEQWVFVQGARSEVVEEGSPRTATS